MSLSFSYGGAGSIPQDSPIKQEPWFQEEKKKLNNFWSLVTEHAAARCWSQSFFTMCQPNSVAACLHKDPETAKRALRMQKRIWEAVLAAEKAVDSKTTPGPIKTELEKRLVDISWHRLQISREICAMCEHTGWTVEAVREQALYLFGGPANTKYDLEDLFAHLQSVARATNLPTAMNKWTRYFYCTTLPSLAGLGWPQLAPTLDDHYQASRCEGSKKELAGLAGKAFKSTSFPLPAEIKSKLVRMRLETSKKAGTASNQRAAAATAWVLQNFTSGFKKADLAWTGLLGLFHWVFQNNVTKTVCLSLGFRTTAALGIRLKRIECGDMVYFILDTSDASKSPVWMFNDDL
ncbi:unnamed protein product, partial [Effrenium voratum]